jgi:hypothetical protein
VLQVLLDPGRTLWRGVALDLEHEYRAKLKKTVVFWGFTSTTTSMDALNAFIPSHALSVRWAAGVMVNVVLGRIWSLESSQGCEITEDLH